MLKFIFDIGEELLCWNGILFRELWIKPSLSTVSHRPGTGWWTSLDVIITRVSLVQNFYIRMEVHTCIVTKSWVTFRGELESSIFEVCLVSWIWGFIIGREITVRIVSGILGCEQGSITGSAKVFDCPLHVVIFNHKSRINSSSHAHYTVDCIDRGGVRSKDVS
jgi:hypothetical protein